MISSPPQPWYDPALCIVAKNCYKIAEHYARDIDISRFNICKYCNTEGLTHLHHIIPRSYLGAHKPINLIELCCSCHKKAENGIIKITGGKYFNFGIKKKNKFLLKLYKNNITLYSDNYDKVKLNFLIKKHLSIDSVIKKLLKTKDYDRIKELKIYWKQQNIFLN